MIKRRNGFLLGLLALMAPAMSASAQDPYALGYGYLFGYGATNTPAIRSFVPAPPYFALHPPVYYGKRYTRPYGESPFASWPQLRSPAGYEPRPAAHYVAPVVINMPPAHVPMEAVPGAPVQPAPANTDPSPVVHYQRAVQPLTIDNPYYLDAKVKEAAQLVAQP